MTDWWKTAFGKNYALLYAAFNARLTPQIVSFLLFVLPPRCRVLDLGCGDGRITKELLAHGYDAVGLDYSAELLELAGAGPFEQGDMRALDMPETFYAVISIFTSFGYFDDKKDDVLVAQNVFRSLKEGGIFILDLNVPKNDDEFVEVSHEADGVTISGRYRQYSEEGARDLLEVVGFTNIKTHWWYSTAPLEGAPRRMIFVAQKPHV